MKCLRGKILPRGTVIDGYAKLGNVERVEYLFKQIPSKDIILWTTLMSCYSKNKRYDEVVKLFDEMVNEGMVVPDEVTITSASSACAHCRCTLVRKRGSFLFDGEWIWY
jgi:pentatricopeptide repeat protein